MDGGLKGITMRLQPSQHEFPVHDVEEVDLEIERTFDYPNLVHSNRFVGNVNPYCQALGLP